jgi:hypothetical protein
LSEDFGPGEYDLMAQLIREHVLDPDGNYLPVDVTAVTYDLQDLTPGGHSLLVHSLSINTATAQVIPACPYCCGYLSSSVIFSPDPVFVLTGITVPLAIDGANSCNGEMFDLSVYFPTWGSSNPAIANVTKRQVQGVAVGQVTGSADGTINGPGECACSPVYVAPTVPITVQVPTTLAGPTNVKTTYTGQELKDCYAQSLDPRVPTFYGYEECESYTVLDQNKNQIKEEGMVFDERVQITDTNVGLTTYTSSGYTDTNFFLKDMLSLGSSTKAPSPGSYAVAKQTLTLHSSGATVRVNCLDFEATDVTVKDITSNPNVTCARN